MKITYYIFSNKGSYAVNEDYAGMAQEDDTWCFTLADGLGGHCCGEVASHTAIRAVKKAIKDNTFDTAEEYLDCAFQNAQEAVMAKQKEDRMFGDMKTTLVVLMLRDGYFQWGHVGDSRVYLFRSGKYTARSFDHSVPQMLALSGEIKEKDIRGHADRNRLLRVIGVECEQQWHELSRVYKMRKNDSFLLCSDGFWDLIDEKTMTELLKSSSDVKEWVDKMALNVYRNGKNKKMDNFTAVGVWVRA